MAIGHRIFHVKNPRRFTKKSDWDDDRSAKWDLLIALLRHLTQVSTDNPSQLPFMKDGKVVFPAIKERSKDVKIVCYFEFVRPIPWLSQVRNRVFRHQVFRAHRRDRFLTGMVYDTY